MHQTANARLALVSTARTILSIMARIKTASFERTRCLATTVEERLGNPRSYFPLAGMPLGVSSSGNAPICVLPTRTDRLQADLPIILRTVDTTPAFRGSRPGGEKGFGVTTRLTFLDQTDSRSHFGSAGVSP